MEVDGNHNGGVTEAPLFGRKEAELNNNNRAVVLLLLLPLQFDRRGGKKLQFASNYLPLLLLLLTRVRPYR